MTAAHELIQLKDDFEHAYPQDILRLVVDTFGSRVAVVTSFQPTGIVTLHMLHEIAPDTPVITLDTGLLFAETYELIDEIEARLNLNLTRVKPDLTLEKQAAQYGDRLWQHNPDQCCYLRKVVPLRRALESYDAWITGLRRDQSPSRSNVPIVSWDAQNRMVKINPLATWTGDMVWTYIQAHNLPYNPLHDQGYPSIGCWPCTRAVEANGRYTRDGRWNGHDKVECGIHLTLSGEDRND